MTLMQWLNFMAMAAAWAAAGQVSAHYAELALQTYRARRTEIWIEHFVRGHLQ